MAWIGLEEELAELLGYSAGVFEETWSSGAARFGAQDGYRNRRAPTSSRRRYGVVSVDEIAKWRKRTPPRGVRFSNAATVVRERVRWCAMQDADLEILRTAWHRVREGRVTTIQGVRRVLSTAA